jgi:hypothetical protein
VAAEMAGEIGDFCGICATGSFRFPLSPICSWRGKMLREDKLCESALIMPRTDPVGIQIAARS